MMDFCLMWLVVDVGISITDSHNLHNNLLLGSVICILLQMNLQRIRMGGNWKDFKTVRKLLVDCQRLFIPIPRRNIGGVMPR